MTLTGNCKKLCIAREAAPEGNSAIKIQVMAWPGAEENSYLNNDESAEHDFHFPNHNRSPLSKFSALIDKKFGPF